MYSDILPHLNINGLVADKPIIQGGMGVGISMAGLASAVANAGGIGVISSVGIGLMTKTGSRNYREANQLGLIEEIRKARKMTDGVLGLNIMVAITDFNEMVQTAFDEGIDLVVLGAGLPLKIPTTMSVDQLRNAHTKVAVIVSSARAAQLIFKSWQKNFQHVPDMVIVEGPKAGGHLGFKREQIDDPAFALENLIPDVLKTVAEYEISFGKNIPVIAAGGIYDGADIQKFLNMGAQGVQMGTRFVATHECDASPEFKEMFLNCTEEDLRIIQSPVGLPGRAINNHFLEEVYHGERKPFNCPWKCLKTCDFREAPYCIARALCNAQKGDLDEGYAFAGANAYRVKEIVSVQELFDALQSEYSEAVLKNPTHGLPQRKTAL